METKKKDITMNSDQELSLIFLNDEVSYTWLMGSVRREEFDIIEVIVEDNFIYTPEQLANLEETYNNEVAEYYAE